MRGALDQHPFDLLEQIERRCRDAARKREFGVQLSGRGSGLLAIRLRERLFTMPLSAIDSIESVPSYTRVPGVQRWLLGIANLRGIVITISDMGTLLFGDAASRQSTSRLIVASYDGWQYGLLVDEVIGLRRFEAAPVETDLELDDERLSRYVDQQRRVGGRLWLGLNLNALLQDHDFQHAALSSSPDTN